MYGLSEAREVHEGKMGIHFDLQAILSYHRDGHLPEEFNKDQRKKFRKRAAKFVFQRGKLFRSSKRKNPVPGGEYLHVVVDPGEQLEIARKEHRQEK